MDKKEMLEGYMLAKPGCTKDYKLEWEWYRYMVGGKMFAAFCDPDEKHRDYGGMHLLSLKCDPERSALLRAEFPDILPGFYMDKRNWISINLDGNVPEDVLLELCDHSYALVFSKLTKKLQREISGT